MQQPVQRQTLRNNQYLLACFCWPGLLVFLDTTAVHLHHRWPTAARGEEAAAEEVLALGAAHPHPPYWFSPISDRPHRHTDYYSEARMDAILIIYAVNVFRRNAGPPLLASAGNASRAVPSNNNKPLTLLYHTLLVVPAPRLRMTVHFN